MHILQFVLCAKAIYNFAQRNDLRITHEYIDRALTGTTDKRPEFLQMVEDSKRKGFQYVVVYQLDRFARNRYDSATYKAKLKKNGVRVLSAKENITDDASGILIEGVLESMAEYYSAELSQKVSRGLQENRNKGLFTGGRVPFGYRVVDKKVVIDEDQSSVILEMFNMYANGAMAKDIIDVIEQRGISHNGKRFLPNAIYNILHNQKYIGRYEIHGKMYTNIYPPIVPLDIFEQVQRRIEHNRIGQVSRETVFLLKGKVFCGYCGKAINGESGTSHTGKVMYYYKCVNKKRNTHNCKKATVRKDILEQKVLDMAMELFTTKVNLDIICDEIMRIHEKHRAEQSVLKLLREDKAKAERSLNNVMLAIEEGIINATTKNRMAELEQKIDELNGKILLEESKLENSITREEVMEYQTHSVRDLSPQALIEILVNRIELYDDEIVVWFNYSDCINPDDPDNDRRDFSLPENYSISVTSRFIIASIKIALR